MNNHDNSNPYVESLGQQLSFNEFAKLVYEIPREFLEPLPDDFAYRQILVETLGTDWFLPEPKHHSLYKDVYRVLHHSYRPRDYRTRLKAFRNTEEWLNNHKNKNWVPVPLFKKPIITISLFGSPGMGKSHFWDKVLSKCFKQVATNKGELQVTYLVLNCSAFNSLKALGNSFFTELDSVLAVYYKSLNLEYQHPYAIEFIKGSYSAEKLLPYIANVAAQVNLGVLIIDEINHLVEGNRDPNDITKFFKNLTRAIGLPVIFSGTQNAIEKLGIDLQSIRRLVGFGMRRWKFYKKDEKLWVRFLTELWKFQVTRECVELTEEIRDLYFDLTGGVLDFSVKLFVRCQTEAIDRNRKIDLLFIEAIHEEFFESTRKVVKAIISKDVFLKRSYQDINEEFLAVLEQAVIENELDFISYKIASMEMSQEQATILINIVKARHSGISDLDAESKLGEVLTNTLNDDKKDELSMDADGRETLTNDPTIPPQGKKKSQEKKEVKGVLTNIESPTNDIKDELNKAGFSGQLNKLIGS